MMFLRTALLVTLCGLGAGCKQSAEPADFVLQGGTVYTMEPGFSLGEGVAIRGDRIVAVGSDDAVASFIGPDTVVEDLNGGVVLPGFVDAHAHPVWGGLDLRMLQLFDVTSMDELLADVGMYAADHPEDAWIQGNGWDAPTFEGQMDRSLLDGVVADRPVCLGAADGHSVWVNTLALEAAGITAATEDPAGGEIVRDADGEATGVLRENATDLIYSVIPADSEAALDEATAAAMDAFHAFGITTIIDANADEDTLAAYARADDAGTLGARIVAAVEVAPEDDPSVAEAIVAMGQDFGSRHVTVEQAKFYIDGVVESETAYMLEPYADGTNGEPAFTDAQLDTLFAAVDAAGLRIHTHAVGDGAVRQVLDAIARLDAAVPSADRRALAAHLEVIDPADQPRFGELGVYADFQALWAYPDTYVTDLTIPVIGEERAQSLYPIRSVWEGGGTLVAGSDWDVTTMNPWEAIEVAVTRRDPDDPTGEVLTPGQEIDRQPMIVAYTLDGARAVSRESDLGTLKIGKYADLVVLDRDPFTIDPTEIGDVRVVTTWFEGRVVYRQGQDPFDEGWL